MEAGLSRWRCSISFALQQTAREYQNREGELQSRVQSLQEQYENQLRAAHEQLRTHEAQMQATIESLQQQYETKLRQQEVPHYEPI
ncbi:hypothetical protein HC766_05665 [Candidatus Gracilibacteria bacterium]|nr:hypothetical protein [Candidatus Gracilibacteria bacterium]